MKDYSNYHEIDTNMKIQHDGNQMLETILQGFDSYDAVLNNERAIRVVLTSKFSTTNETKNVIGRIQDIERGNLLEIDGFHWLITTLPEDNKVYRKAEIKICNTIFKLESDKTTILMRDENGDVVYDRFNDPVYIEVDGESWEEPCIYETRFPSTNENEQLPLPDGRIHITLRYQKADNLKINHEFDLNNSRYKISDFDYSKVINGVGVMTIIADRVVRSE